MIKLFEDVGRVAISKVENSVTEGLYTNLEDTYEWQIST